MAEHDIFDNSSLKGNSYKSRSEKSIKDFKMDKVISEKVEVKKESLGAKLFKTFIVSDPKSVGLYLVRKKLVPKIKATIVELVSSGIDMMFTGNTSSSNKDGGFYANNNVPYYSYSISSNTKTTASEIVQKTSPYDYQQIIFPTIGAAKEVKDALQSVIDMYQCVRVADFYNAVGHPTTTTDNNYGWKSLENAPIESTDKGYIIRMPKPVPLDYVK